VKKAQAEIAALQVLEFMNTLCLHFTLCHIQSELAAKIEENELTHMKAHFLSLVVLSFLFP
jgi:hypothetical protein